MKRITSSLVIAALMLLASSCAKEDSLKPAVSLSEKGVDKQVVGGPDWQRGYNLGKSDALALARSLSSPCPEIPSGETGMGGNDGSGPKPEDPFNTQLQPPKQGSNTFCFDGYSFQQFEYNINGWMDSAQQHADDAAAAGDAALSAYYQGYRQGLIEYHLP